jgi:hypothetical protein
MRLPLVSPAILVALLLVVACEDVQYDYDTTVDFSMYRTYAWKGSQRVQQDLVHKRIVDSVDAVLASKGLAKLEKTEGFPGPDLLVTYHAAYQEQVRITDWGYWGPYGYGPGFWGPWYSHGGPVTVDTLPVGTLVIDLVDAARKQLVWRSICTDYIQSRSPEEADQAVRHGVEAMLRNYPPPKPKGK